MPRINTEAVKNIAFHAVLLLVVYVFQAEVFTYLRIFGYVPVLLPMAAVGVGMLEGGGRGSVFGLFAGIFCDVSFNQPAAAMTLTLTVVGLLAGYLGETVIRRGFLSFCVCCLGALLLTAFVQMFGQLFFEDAEASALLVTALCEAGCSLIFALPMYWAVSLLGRKVRAA